MSYSNSQQIEQLEEQNYILQESLTQLNFCYQEKVSILEEEIRSYDQKYQKILQDKRDEADRMANQIGRYQTQITKLLNLVDTLYNSFQKQKEAFNLQLEKKNQMIAQLEQKRQLDQRNVQELAEKYTFEITKLQEDLKELKEEDLHKKNKQEKQEILSQNKEDCLKDISNIPSNNQQYMNKLTNFQPQEVLNQ